MSEPLFKRSGDVFHPTEMARGPWDPRAQHGGAPAALIVDRLSKLAPGGRLTRVSVELMRPVPLSPLTLQTQVVKSGRMVQRTEAELHADGVTLVRAEGLHVTPGADHIDIPDESLMRRNDHEVMPALGEARESRLPRDLPTKTFSTHAMDIRFVAGRFNEPGPGAAWFRLKVPVVDNEPVHPWSRVAAGADFCNDIGTVMSWTDYTFLNADLIMAVSREPRGEWIGVHAAMHASADGVGISEGQLHDEDGCIGVAMQSLLIRPRK